MLLTFTAQKTKFSIKDFFSKCDQIRNFLQIWSHLLKKSLLKNFIFCAVICPKLGIPTHPSLQILGKTQTGVFPIS